MPYLLKYSLKRIALAVVTLFIILTITFFLVKSLPDQAISGNTVSQVAYCNDMVSQGYYLAFHAEMSGYGSPVISPYTDPTGLVWYYYRAPLIQQYGAWLKGVFTSWDWGVSTVISDQTDVWYVIVERLQPTVLINIVAVIISVPLGFVFGIIAALNKNKPIDSVISTLVMVFISVPSFVIISLLILWMGYYGGLPTHWPTSLNPTVGEIAPAMVIPVLALCFGTIASFTRYTRAELCEVMSSDFMLLARTKGLSKTQCITKHAIRNSLVPLVPMIVGEFVGILGGSMVLENLYSIPGIGSLFISSINGKDYNLLMADMAVYTAIGLAANLLVDLTYGIVDPRIRMGAKAS